VDLEERNRLWKMNCQWEDIICISKAKEKGMDITIDEVKSSKILI